MINGFFPAFVLKQDNVEIPSIVHLSNFKSFLDICIGTPHSPWETGSNLHPLQK